MQENKICSRCKENKSVELFYKRSGTKGYHSLCKDCEKQATKEWYENNRESALIKVKDWRKKNVDRIIQQWKIKVESVPVVISNLNLETKTRHQM